MRLNNIIIAGIWFGTRKPDMDKLLLPILNEIRSLSVKGIDVISSNGINFNIKPKLVMGIFDLPARAVVTNTVQFNGAFGCLYCTNEGVYTSHRRIYLPCEQDYQLRTGASINELADAAEACGEPVRGIKGHSVLVSSQLLDLPQCVPIDYMHSVLEGAFKSLLKHWFDSKYHNEPYSIRRDITYIDKAVSRIRPPREIPRLPRSISLLSFWKASEFRSWMFYSLPILSEFLPSEYVHHLALLVVSIFVLLSDRISKNDLDVVEELLCTFQALLPVLYTPLLCTANMHSLVHLVQVVRLWGPLWAYSMFSFENVNGYLGKCHHGTGETLKQMVLQLRLQQSLPGVLDDLKKNESNAAKLYIDGLINPSRNNMQMILPDVYLIGKLSCDNFIDQEELRAVITANISVTPGCLITRAGRCMIKGTVYYTTVRIKKILGMTQYALLHQLMDAVVME